MCLFFVHETKTFANEPTARHAIAMHGAPKYLRNFKHFEYVNPNAPKGGAVVNEATGTFDSFNMTQETFLFHIQIFLNLYFNGVHSFFTYVYSLYVHV